MKYSQVRTFAIAVSLCLVGSASRVLADPPPGPPSSRVWPALTDQAENGSREFVAKRSGVFGGHTIKYRASLTETLVKSPDGKPAASAFTLEYTAEVKDATNRPVLFIYNGGPGGASSTLFFGAFGPVHITPFTDAAMADPTVQVTANPVTVLDAADLVFIDPPDTGFSRRLAATPPRLFLSIDGDSFAIGQIIQHWLSKHGRLASPVYLVGESYGTLRNVALARDLARATPKIRVEGLVMISQAIRYNGPDELMQKRGPDPLRAVSRMPDLAALAWYHGKIDNQHQSVGEAIEKARLYARTGYVDALLQGNRLDDSSRREVAAHLSSLTGLSTTYYLEHGLRAADARKELLKDEGLALAQFDGRTTEPLAGLPEDKDRDWDAASAGLDHAMGAYVTRELGAKGLEPYKSIVHDPYGYEEGWTYVVAPAPTLDAVLTDVMKADPHLRLMVPQGIFDTTSSMGSTVSMFQQLDIPADRIAICYYAGGHMVYADPAAHKKFMDDLRSFLGGQHPDGAYPTLVPKRPSH